MKNIKDRTIRKDNVPKEQLIYQSQEGFSYTFFVLLLFGISLIILNVKVYLIAIILTLFYVFLTGSYKIKFEVRENFLLHYISEDVAEIFYYSEIINYRINHDDKNNIILNILTDDESEHKFILSDSKVIVALDKVVGAKKVGQ